MVCFTRCVFMARIARVEGDEEEKGDGDEDEDDVDLDMLPTLLAYKAGQLEHTWIRVDWEASGLEELLDK